jgi:Cu+-exporting ATPase
MKYLLLVFVAAACCAVGCERREPTTSSTSAVVRVKDPVCGMMVDKSSAAKTSTWEGNKYYFCSKECHDKFEQAPGTYIGVK